MDAAHGIHAECSGIWALAGRLCSLRTFLMLRCLAQRVLLFNSQLPVRRLTHAERFAAAVPLPLRAPRDSRKLLPYFCERTKV